MDLFDRLTMANSPLGQYASRAGDYYMFPKLEGPIGSRMKFLGQEVVCWSINNYIGLADHPEVRKVDAEAARDWGLAYPMGARMMSGNSVHHEKLEQDLADFVGKESGVLLNFGYQGIMSTIDAMLDRHDIVIYDAESHASIVDGVRMHLGRRFQFDHNDSAVLEKHLARATKMLEGKPGGILVITEGVFGMRGDQGKLREIVALKKDYQFRLLVDDAHGFGILGETGAGAGEHQGVQDEIDVYFSTFAKSMASIGAFLAGPADVMQYLKYKLRSQIFAKSLPMPLVIGAQKRLELLKTQPQLRKKLWENVEYLQSGLQARGFNIGDTNSAVTPVYMSGTVGEATQLVHDLRANFSIFCSVVVYPVIPKGMIILRLIPTAVHSKEDIDLTLKAFEYIGRNLSEGKYKGELIINPLKA